MSEKTLTREDVIARFTNPETRPKLKGSLIDRGGDGGETCYCAQGCILHWAGWPDDDIEQVLQSKADKEVSRILGCSVTESIFLREINDSQDGCPERVLSDLPSLLGPDCDLWVAFARHIDSLSQSDWQKVKPAWAAARSSAGWDAARDAAFECIGYSRLKKTFFLNMFFDDVSVWVESVRSENSPICDRDPGDEN